MFYLKNYFFGNTGKFFVCKIGHFFHKKFFFEWKIDFFTRMWKNILFGKFINFG